MNSELKYFILNGDTAFAYIYENKEYGRTIVIVNPLDFSKNLKTYSYNGGQPELLSNDLDFVKYIYSILPMS